MCKKGIFPYEYIDSIDKLNETCLPPIESFKSSLNNKTCTQEDYLHALNVWNKFKCNTLRDYMILYLKTGVLLLTDVFENFRNFCLNIYKLDPAHYITIPSLAWDAMLKSTKVKLELLTDFSMYTFLKKGIRGGIVQCSQRHSIANNKYLSTFNSNMPI